MFVFRSFVWQFLLNELINVSWLERNEEVCREKLKIEIIHSEPYASFFLKINLQKFFWKLFFSGKDFIMTS